MDESNDRLYTFKVVAAILVIILSIAIGIRIAYKSSKGKRVETIVRYTTEAGEVIVERHAETLR